MFKRKFFIAASLNSKALNKAVARIYFIIAFIPLFFAIISLKILDYSFVDIEEREKSYNVPKIKSRGEILDTVGNVVALNIPTASLYAHPIQMIDREKSIKQILNSINVPDAKSVSTKILSGKKFVWIKRHLTPSEQESVHNLGLPGVYMIDDEKRIYPHDNLFSHILGYVDVDGNGIAGIERKYNNQLSSGESIHLSVDLKIQNILREELEAVINMHSAIGGTAILADANDGSLLGMVSLPDFNPNNFDPQKNKENFHQATLGVYEMGSVFKAFTMAMAYDLDKVSNYDYFDVSAPIKIGRFRINDYRGKGGRLSVPEVLQYSSNIGIAKIASLIGIKDQYTYLKKLGVLDPVAVELPEVSRPLYPSQSNWNYSSMVTISYGHGIAVTPLHLMQAFGAIINGGVFYKSTILKQNNLPKGKRVIKESTSLHMRKLLNLVVESGYSRQAGVDGYFVGGKTGTAEKLSRGRYSKHKNLAVFTGAFPIYNPKYVLFIAVDEAKPNKINHGFTTGGMIAAPVASNIIQKVGPMLGLYSAQKDQLENLSKVLYLDYKPVIPLNNKN